MRFLPLLLLAVMAGLVLLPATALAQTSGDVTVTASGNVTTGCPSHLIITAVTDYEIVLVWNLAGNATTMLRVAYGRVPSNTTDGLLLYEGNATTYTQWINTEFFTVPIIYRAWADWGNGTYSECYAQATLPTGGALEELAEGVTSLSGQVENIWDLLTVLSYFVLPLFCALAYQWKGSIVFAVPAFLSAWLAMPYLADHGWHYATPLMVLAILILLKLLYQAFTGGIKV